MTRNYLEELKAPFEDCELEWRVNRVVNSNNGLSAIVVPYVRARAIMNRFDQVFGIENWMVKYSPWKEKATKCTISVRINNEWVEKEDGAEDTEYESIKGGFSAALKRAAVLFGVGRYLYYINTQWADLHDSKKTANDIFTKHNNKGYYFTPPTLRVPKSTNKEEKNDKRNATGQSAVSQIQNDIVSLMEPLNISGSDLVYVYNQLYKTKLKNLNNVKDEQLKIIKARLELIHRAKRVQGKTPDQQFHNWLSIRLGQKPIRSYRDWLLYDIRALVNELVDMRINKPQSA